jgi:hypothetical protein
VTESELTRECVRRLNKLPLCFAFRVHGGPHQRKGTLDIVGCIEGAFFSIEMKLPGKERNLTEIQSATISKLEACGALVGVATSYIECLEILGVDP